MQHIIQSHVFDIEFYDASRAYALQDKISDIFNRELVLRMERLFDSLVPAEATLVFDDVHIDIGSIDISLLDDDLAGRILAELEKVIRESIALGRNIQAEPTGSEPRIKTQGVNRIEMLRYFLLTGAMPWWASDELAAEPVKLAEYLLADDAAGLRQLILDAGKFDYGRRRMVYQFSDEVIRNIITLLEPAEADFIFDYHASVTKAHRRDELVKSAPSQEFEKALWVFILTYLLIDRGTLFNQKVFLQSTIGQMAQHYNRDYTELLTLLARTLSDDKPSPAKNNHLGMLIKELFHDEVADVHQPGPKSISGDRDEQIKRNLELIRYYLLFGSLPWWAEPYSAGGLMQLLLGLTDAVPETFGRMIADVGRNEPVRMRITGTFADEAIVAVVRTLEPMGAPFIINYVDEVQSLHVKKAIVQTGNVSFRKTVWDLVFKFLLEHRGSEFNERMFLASNIRALAQNYNVAYSDILAYFFQSIGQLHQDSTLHVPLFKLLAELINDDRESQSRPAGGTILTKKDDQSAEEGDIDPARKDILLKDVLLHWLSYGYIPWWASEYFSWDAAAMFNELLANSPGDAALLLRFAGSSPNMRQRAIYQLPFELTVSLFELYPQGNKAAEWYEFFLTALINSDYEIPADLLSAGKDMLQIVWDNLIGGQYRSFDQQRFLQIALDYIAERGELATSAVIASLRKVLIAAKRPDYKRVLDKLLVARHFRDLPPVAGSDQHLQIEWLFLPGDEQDKYEPHALLRLLDYFQADQKRPGWIGGKNREVIDAKVKQLLSNFGSGLTVDLGRLFEGTNEFRLSAHAGPNLLDGTDIARMIAEQERSDASKDGHAGYVLKLLESFLTRGELPPYLKHYNILDILKYMLTMLYYEKPAALEHLMRQTGQHRTARMMLHDSIAVPETLADNRIVSLLKPFAELDVIAYIEQVSATGTVSSARLADLLAPYIAALHRHSDVILALLKRPAIVKYISSYFNDAAVTELAIMHPGAFGGREEVRWLSQFQRLIKTSLTDTLLQDEMSRLFIEFNLMIFGGHVSVRSRADYLKAFFAFLSSRNNALYHRVSEAITRTISDNKTASLKWLPQVAGQLQAYRTIQEGRIAAEKVLNRAAEIARQCSTTTEQPATRKKLEKQLKDELEKGRKQADAAEKDQSRGLLTDDKNAIYIANAGLVLLSPFLPVYFVRLGLVQAGKFIDTEKQLRAVHLLQYLVTGSIGYPEHQLVLNKILCNLPVEEPVQLDIDITEHELEVSDEMLKAVLNSWEKLKNTSIEGFRASFLQRNGALVYKDEAWNLRVEQRGYDVLLQTLPWTIGIIKTPWMDNFLYVEWT